MQVVRKRHCPHSLAEERTAFCNNPSYPGLGSRPESQATDIWFDII